MKLMFRIIKLTYLFLFIAWCSFSSYANNNSEIQHSLINNKKPPNPTSLQQEVGHISFSHKKEYTLIVYMAANNDLARFALKNLLQLAKVGSNSRLNICVHLDITLSHKKKVTLRYYIKKNKLVILNHDDQKRQSMDSGDPNTLIDCCQWAIKNFPAKHYILDLWNHGLGCLDFAGVRTINTFNLFTFNAESELLELDRSIPFLKLVELHQLQNQRGICFDDTTGNFLTNQDLAHAFSVIQNTCLNNEKFAIIAFDACLMSMIEIGNIVKRFANIMIGSQEVVLGAGYDYVKIVTPIAQSTITPIEFAKLIVDGYKTTYASITNDYTHSAIDLHLMDALEKAVDYIAQLFLTALKEQKKSSVIGTLKKCRHTLLCTHFDEPSYIDLGHFLQNVFKEIKNFHLRSKKEEKKLHKELRKAITEGLKTLKKIVIANACGKNLKNAQGISIYFPEKYLYASYQKTEFAKTNAWLTFLRRYTTSQ